MQAKLEVIRRSWASIFLGSVAKSDKDAHLFVWVVKKNEGNLDTIFLQIGDSIEKGTKYPKNLLPYRKDA